MEIREALTFDDVLLVPGASTVLPGDAEMRTRVTREIELNIPLLSSAMLLRRFDRIARDCEACVSTIFLCGAARPGVAALKSIGHAPKYGVLGLTPVPGS